MPYYDYVKERTILDSWTNNRLKKDLKGHLTSDGPPDVQESEETVSRLIAENQDIAPNGVRDYWNTTNSRSRDLLPGLDKLAELNDPKSTSGTKPEDGDTSIKWVVIDGKDIKLKIHADGRAEELGRSDGEVHAKMDQEARLAEGEGSAATAATAPKSEGQKSNEMWDKRIGAKKNDQDLETLVVDVKKKYDGETVLKLIRQEKMRKGDMLWRDQALMALCLLIIGLAMGVAFTDIMVRYGIKKAPLCRMS